ncbi:MAG TPA: molybdenum cofactor guanylyltransferase [Acidimicrobiales bacterium]|nr:molybdenum cofactor guanylyltransferase [Acidimicrobiales bacterium]
MGGPISRYRLGLESRRRRLDRTGEQTIGRGVRDMGTGVGTEQRAARPPVAGLLLTGGASRRMGTDKASIVLADGRTCAQTVAARLAEVADPVLEIGPGATGLTAVPDDRPGAGPLAALATGWAALVGSGHAGPVLVLACDLPRVTVAVLELLARASGDDTVVPVVGGRPQPLCARFGPASLDQCQRLLDEGRRSLMALLDVTPVVWLGPEVWSEVVDEQCFADMDTPEDLVRVLAHADRGSTDGVVPER